MRRSRLFLVNTGSTFISRVGGNLLSFVTLPLFVGYFGDSLYGVFVLAVGVTESLALFDFGTKNALVRYTAEYLVDKDQNRYDAAVAGSLIIAGVLGIVFALFVFGLSFVAPGAFSIEAENTPVSVDVFQLAALYTLVFIVARVAQSVLEGHQMFYWNNINQTVVLAINLALFFVVKYWGLSFYAFAGLMMLGRLVPAALNILVIANKKLLKGVSLRRGLNKDIVRSEFFHYSANLFALQIIAFCAVQLDKFVIGGILSAAAVTTYVVVTKPMYIIRMISNQTLMVLAPILAEIGRRGDDSRLNSIMRRGNLALSILVFPMVALVAIFVQQFIDLWIGGAHSAFAYWGGVASFVFLFTPFYGIASRTLTYTGNIVVVRNINFWTTMLNVVISIVSTYFLGIGGVIVGSLVQAAIQVPIYFRVMDSERGLSIADMIPPMFWVNAAFVAVVGFGLFLLVQQIDLSTWTQFGIALLLSTSLLYSLGAWIVMKQGLLANRLG